MAPSHDNELRKAFRDTVIDAGPYTERYRKRKKIGVLEKI